MDDGAYQSWDIIVNKWGHTPILGSIAQNVLCICAYMYNLYLAY